MVPGDSVSRVRGPTGEACEGQFPFIGAVRVQRLLRAHAVCTSRCYAGKPLGELIALTKDKDKYVRQAAAWGLADIRSDAKSAVPTLTELLKDKDQDVRRVAASALGCIWHDAKSAVPALNRLLGEGRPLVNHFSRRALARLSGKMLGRNLRQSISNGSAGAWNVRQLACLSRSSMGIAKRVEPTPIS